MKLLKLTMISMSVLALAAPAAMAHAQPADTAASSAHHDWTLKEREDWLQHRLDQARDDGSIGGDEYRHVRNELEDVQAQESSLRGRHDGGQLTDSETASLESRLDYIGDRIHWLRSTNLDRPW